jgi:hypothetical protein
MLLRAAENNRGLREHLKLEAARQNPSGVDLRRIDDRCFPCRERLAG